jgi:hypothetical protein
VEIDDNCAATKSSLPLVYLFLVLVIVFMLIFS